MSKFVEAKSYSTAKRRCPWAAKIARVYGGYICFSDVADYKTWRAQK